MKFRGDRHGSSEAPHQSADMGKADPLSGFVLGSGTSKQVKDSLMVFGIDAASIVSDLENREAEFGASPHGD